MKTVSRNTWKICAKRILKSAYAAHKMSCTSYRHEVSAVIQHIWFGFNWLDENIGLLQNCVIQNLECGKRSRTSRFKFLIAVRMYLRIHKTEGFVKIYSHEQS